jgi:hypothetical protein
MARATKNLMNLAVGLARELPHLRPSQQRQISQSLETPEQVWVLSKAVELALQTVAGESDEVLERVYLLGLEVRQIFDARSATDLHFTARWESISPAIVEAFAGGFRRSSFEGTLDAVRSSRLRESEGAASAARHVYEIDDARIVTVFEAEDVSPVANSVE